jgi:hypothetical protein
LIGSSFVIHPGTYAIIANRAFLKEAGELAVEKDKLESER